MIFLKKIYFNNFIHHSQYLSHSLYLQNKKEQTDEESDFINYEQSDIDEETKDLLETKTGSVDNI